MKRNLCLLAMLGVLALSTPFLSGQQPTPPTAAQTNDTVEALRARLDTHVGHSRFANAQWGIKVVSLETGKVVYEQNATKLMKPASNAKMYTGALALDRLGPDHRIKTSFYASTRPDNDGVLKSDLVIYGRGDPSFSWRFHNGDYAAGFQPVIDAVLNAGIKQIDGDLVADDSYFRGSPFGTAWTVDDLQCWYGAPASALSVQDNVIDLIFKPGAKIGDPLQIITHPETTFICFSNRTTTAATNSSAQIQLYRPVGENVTYVWGRLPLGDQATDSVAVHQPALWFGTLLKEALVSRGVKISGNVRAVNWLEREVNPLDQSTLIELASIQSPPVAELVKAMMKPSQNLYAHLLLMQVGVKKQPTQAQTQWAENAGLAEMRKFLSEAGIPRNTVMLEEGSGLSRGCLLTPDASVRLLTFMSKHRHASVFIDALPLAGVDGTLRSRFKGTAAEKNVRAKTGSLGFVNTLSGFLTTHGNEKMVFSIMLNAYRDADGNHSGRSEIDGLVRMLAEFNGRTQAQ